MFASNWLELTTSHASNSLFQEGKVVDAFVMTEFMIAVGVILGGAMILPLPLGHLVGRKKQDRFSLNPRGAEKPIGRPVFRGSGKRQTIRAVVFWVVTITIIVLIGIQDGQAFSNFHLPEDPMRLVYLSGLLVAWIGVYVCELRWARWYRSTDHYRDTYGEKIKPDCHWIRDKRRPEYLARTRWICATCGVDAFTDGKPPENCHSAAKPRFW